jgi:hypothetical protein
VEEDPVRGLVAATLAGPAARARPTDWGAGPDAVTVAVFTDGEEIGEAERLAFAAADLAA